MRQRSSSEFCVSEAAQCVAVSSPPAPSSRARAGWAQQGAGSGVHQWSHAGRVICWVQGSQLGRAGVGLEMGLPET